jgi:hypothetical protein
MGPDAREGDLGIEIFFMTFQARFFCRDYGFGFRRMAVKTCRLYSQVSLVGFMVELECQDGCCQDTYQNSGPKDQAPFHSWSPVKNLR